MKKDIQKQRISTVLIVAALILIASDKSASPKDFAAYLLAASSVIEQLGKGKEEKQ